MAVAYGTIAIVPKGVWNAGTEYNVGHLVELDGSSYVAKAKPPVGTLPTNTAYWQVSATGTSKATADNAGVVKPDGVTTKVDENAALSVKTAQQNAVGVVKGSAGIKVGADGSLDVNTEFEQAATLANIIAGEAIAQVLGKVSKAIATTMNLDQNALLKNMLTGIDVNDANKVPNAAFIHTLVERIGMGADLGYGFANLTAGLNSVKKGLDDANSNLGEVNITVSKLLKRYMLNGSELINCNDLPLNSVAYTYPSTINSPGSGWHIFTFGLYETLKVQIASAGTGVKTRRCIDGTWSAWA